MIVLASAGVMEFAQVASLSWLIWAVVGMLVAIGSSRASDARSGSKLMTVRSCYRKVSAPTRSALTRHRRLAASMSYDFSFDLLGLPFAKYVPVIPSTAEEDAR